MTFLEKIIQQKQVEVAAMPLETRKLHQQQRPSFYQHLREHPTTMQLIAEIKRASPSKGALALELDLLSQALSYQAAGVAAISVLTDEAFFKGSINDLRQVAEAVDLPILCKDFIISEKQLIRAYNAGASIVLLIVAALANEKLIELYNLAKQLGLEVLVEVHNLAELKIAEALDASLIGVNNRNLATFEVSIAVSQELATHFTKAETACYISESGFQTPQDVAEICQNYQAVLVGEALVRAKNPQQAAAELQVLRCL